MFNEENKTREYGMTIQSKVLVKKGKSRVKQKNSQNFNNHNKSRKYQNS